MFRSAMAARFALGFSLFVNPILAATIGLSPSGDHSFEQSGALSPGGLAAASASSRQVVSLDREALLELSGPDQCGQNNCVDGPLLSVATLMGPTHAKADRAMVALDEELLELFHNDSLQRSDAEGLFWRISSPIAVD